MTTGIIITVLGIVAYFVNIVLIRYYINKRMPEILDIHEKSPDGNYAWEYTAGTGTVPKWVSMIGLLGFGFFVLGIIIIIVSFFI